jgi:hypothetical protein
MRTVPGSGPASASRAENPDPVDLHAVARSASADVSSANSVFGLLPLGEEDELTIAAATDGIQVSA